ncbi:MAG: uncharacterized protein QOD42_1056 [Sphingomonadales bacterium]|jgi:uncharacterized protein YggE|nr:uncharacterized protein [Sphingomonadales bacterium]
MIRKTGRAALLALALAMATPAAAQLPDAQIAPIPALAGTRLDVTATGQLARIPDVARVEAGVVTQARTAAEAMRQNSALMARVRAALVRAGVADRDVQTTSFNLGAYYITGPAPAREQIFAGYRTSNRLIIRLRDVSRSGQVLDALVNEGVNDIDGPSLDFENRDVLMDEARTLAIAAARARAELYARGLGMRVKRAVLIDEGGGYSSSNNVANLNTNMVVGSTIDTGGRVISATVSVVFELE